MGVKLTQQEFESRIRQIHGDKIDISKFVYKGNAVKGECKCNVCGNVWMVKPMSLFMGSGCRKCYDKRNSEKRITPLEEVNEKIRENNGTVEIIGEYVDTKHKCLARCLKCGHEWHVNVRELIDGHKCPECFKRERTKRKEEKIRKKNELREQKAKERAERQKTEKPKYPHIKLTDEQITERVAAVYGDTITVLKIEEQGQQRILTCHCNICGHKWTASYMSIIQNNKCPQCKEKFNKEVQRKKEEERQETQEKERLESYRLKAIEKCKDKGLTDFEFYYDENRKLMVKFYCHNKDIEGVEHGWRVQSGISFLVTFSCSACARPSRAYTTEDWVKLAKAKYPEYDYSRVNYVDKKTKVTIGCKKHGFIDVNPKFFLYKSMCGCPECRKEQMHDEMVASTIEKAKQVHGDKYIYHPELIKSSTEKMGIECPKHGIFYQSISNHIRAKSGCPICYKEDYESPLKMTFEEVVERAREVHGDKYTYHKETYVNTMTNTTVTCPRHGDFTTVMHRHLIGAGCPKCGAIEGGIKARLQWKEVLKRFNQVHKCCYYDYSKCEEYYEKSDTRIPVICHKKFKNGEEHGVFWTTASIHISGNGCPKCKMSRLEREVYISFLDNNIECIPQYRNNDIIKRGKSLDFYIENLKLGIECQGEQHFVPVMYRRKGWTKEKAAEKYQEIRGRDERKYDECKEGGIEVIYYTSKFLYEHYCKDGYLGPVFWNKEELLNYIIEKIKTTERQ